MRLQYIVSSTRYVLVILSGVFGGSILAGAENTAPADVRALEQKVVDYRNSANFKRGRVTFRKTIIRPGGANDEFEYRVSFSGSNIRFDWRARTLGAERWGGWHQHVVTSDQYIRDYPNGTVVHKGRNSEYKNVRQTYQIFHPHALGTNLSGTFVLAESGLYHLLGRSDRSSFTLKDGKVGAQDAKMIQYVLSSSPLAPKYTVWIVPDKGFAILKARSLTRHGDDTLISTMESDYRKWGETWYPKHIEYQFLRSGKLERRETVAVESAEFGVPIASSTFTIAGLRLAPGRHVSDTTAGTPGDYTWKNGKLEKLLPQLERQSSDDSTTEAAPSRFQWYIAGAFLFALLSCVMVFLGLRHRRGRTL